VKSPKGDEAHSRTEARWFGSQPVPDAPDEVHQKSLEHQIRAIGAWCSVGLDWEVKT